MQKTEEPLSSNVQTVCRLSRLDFFRVCDYFGGQSGEENVVLHSEHTVKDKCKMLKFEKQFYLTLLDLLIRKWKRLPITIICLIEM